MEFKVNSKEFEKLLNKIIPAVPSRTPMPILENFLFEIKDGLLTVYATDLEILLKSSLNIVSEQNISFAVPAKLLFDVVRSLGDTTINVFVGERGKLQLKTDNGEYTLSYLDANDFPEVPSFPTHDAEESDVREITINGENLRSAFDYTSFAMSKEEMRPAMMGTLFEFIEDGLRFVATDGHRLSNLLNKSVAGDFEEKFVVPERAISVLHKVLDEKDVKIYLSKAYISFVLSDIELITRLIAQKYPDYSSVIPLENEFFLHVKTKEIHDSVKRMMLFSTSNTRRVKFSIAENNIQISAEDLDIGASGVENVQCNYSGEPLEIGFNSAYVNDILSHIKAENIKLKLHSPTKAVIVEPADKTDDKIDLMMLLMPVRLNN